MEQQHTVLVDSPHRYKALRGTSSRQDYSLDATRSDQENKPDLCTFCLSQSAQADIPLAASMGLSVV